MQAYKDFQPTGFDSKGAFLEDRDEWLVVPVGQTRDSGPLALSNFNTALEMLGGESDTVEVHRFGHWGPGWFEIIIVDPADTDRVKVATEIEESLENYPVLDECDFSSRETDDYLVSWDLWARRDFVRQLVGDYGLSDKSEELLDDCDSEVLREFYESGIPSGEYYVSEDSGVSIRLTNFKARRHTVAGFLRKLRSEKKAKVGNG